MNRNVISIMSGLKPAPITRERHSKYEVLKNEIKLMRERGYKFWECAEILKKAGFEWVNSGGIAQFVSHNLPELVNKHSSAPLALAAAKPLKRGRGRPKGSTNKVK